MSIRVFRRFLRSVSSKNGLKVRFGQCLCGHFKKYNFFEKIFAFFGVLRDWIRIGSDAGFQLFGVPADPVRRSICRFYGV